MKIDQEYLKRLLNTFVDSSEHFVELSDFQSNCIAVDEKFIFHMQMLEDQSLIECLNKDKDLGYSITMSGTSYWTSKPLRLTAPGLEFAEALNRKEIWEALKSGFKDASLSILTAASKELLAAFVKKKAKEHFGL
ncbi:MAG: DUF2513 domain-containing protein [Gammaproteobacteria bacterium]|nr:DUF2513 domain-containing protein [Gammaproteobacteria bacterium]